MIPTKEHIKSGVVSENAAAPKDVSLRDHFAGKAIQGTLFEGEIAGLHSYEHLAIEAYKFADAMLKAREKK